MFAQLIRRVIILVLSSLLLAAPTASFATAPVQAMKVAPMAATTDPAPSCLIQLVAGDPADPIPPPTCSDRSGWRQDEFRVPVSPYGILVIYGVDGSYVDPGVHQPTGGKSVVTVETFDAVEGVDGPTWRLTFSTATTAIEAKNSLATFAGTCIRRTGRTTVEYSIKNPLDGSSLYVEGYVQAVRSDGWDPYEVVSDSSGRVHDGMSVRKPFALGLNMPELTGVFPGWYKVSLLRIKPDGYPGSVLATTRLWVPRCGGYGPPVGSPPPPGSTGPAKSKQPRAVVRQLRAKGKPAAAAKVRMINHKVRSHSRFKVVVNPPRGKMTIHRYKLKPNRAKARTFRRAYNTKVTVLVYSNNTKKWRRVASKVIRAEKSGSS